MFWSRILPEAKLTLDAEPAAFRRGGERFAKRLPTPEEVKIDLQLAMMEAQHEQRRDQLRRKGLYMKAAAWALTYVGGVAMIWAVIQLFG